MRTAVLVHGYHGGAANWDKVMFGTKCQDGRVLLGRAPKGIRVALELEAKLIIWGSVPKVEPRFTHKLISGLSSEMRDAIESFDHHFDWKSSTTLEEIEHAANESRINDIERLVLVSSPTHFLRCHLLALQFLWNRPEYEKLLENLQSFRSDICYEGTTPDDVVVLEPWHRPDRPNLHLPELGKAILSLPPGEAHNWLRELEEVIARYGGKI